MGTILNRCADNFRLLRRCGIRRLFILEFWGKHRFRIVCQHPRGRTRTMANSSGSDCVLVEGDRDDGNPAAYPTRTLLSADKKSVAEAGASSGLGKPRREKKQKKPSAKIAGPSEYNKRVAEFLYNEEAPHYDHCDESDKTVRMANLRKACGSIQKCGIAITSQTVATVQKLLGVGKKTSKHGYNS